MAIALTCAECERDLRVKDELAGRKIKCPECGGVIAVPAGRRTSAVAAGAPAKSPKPPPEYDDDEDRPRKKKKKKKSNKGLLIGLIIGGVLLLGGGIVLIIVLTRGGDDNKTQAKGDKKQFQPAPMPMPDANKPFEPPPKAPATGIRRAGERADVQNNLRQVGLAYHMCCDSTGRAPQKLEDLEPFYEKNPTITEMLKTKYVIFLYGTKPTQMTQGTSNTVLAYESQLDQQGIRITLMGDGSLTFMNEAEFKAAPKAGQK
jgi:hypothetical protein